MFTDLIQKFLLSDMKKSVSLKGGATMIANEMTGGQKIEIFLWFLALFIIKVLLVMISYNIVGPRIMEKWGKDPDNFRPLSFVESIFIVILFNNLFNRF